MYYLTHSAAAGQQAGTRPADPVGHTAAAGQRGNTERTTRLSTEPNPERIREPAPKTPVNLHGFRHSSDTPILKIHFS